MEENVAFLPHLQESIMDELRTTEGMIFRDEGAKKLFLDTKSFLIETLGTKWKNFDAETFQEALDNYIAWNEAVAEEELQRANASYKDISERLTSVTVLYAKYLYARSNPDSNISIRKPRLAMLLKGMFTRLARMHHVRNGSFFDLDPLRQDFVVRDVFRQTLGTDCIDVIDDSAVTVVQEDAPSVADKHEAVEEKQAVEQQESSRVVEDEEVYPDDSISRVMERMPVQNQSASAENNTALSTSSKAHSRVSEFRKPSAIRRVQISDENESNE